MEKLSMAATMFCAMVLAALAAAAGGEAAVVEHTFVVSTMSIYLPIYLYLSVYMFAFRIPTWQMCLLFPILPLICFFPWTWPWRTWSWTQ